MGGWQASLLGAWAELGPSEPPCCPQSIPVARGRGRVGEGMSQLTVEVPSGPLLPGLPPCPGLSLSLWLTSFRVSRSVVQKEWTRCACLCDCGYTGRGA